MEYREFLVSPSNLFSRNDFIIGRSRVGMQSGIYGFFFSEIPPKVPIQGCIKSSGKTLLYLGISPSKENGNPRLVKRLKNHFTKTANVSTLRMSLGCLLSTSLEIELEVKSKIIKNGKLAYKFWFGQRGEEKINQWMDKNAFFTYKLLDKPWDLEKKIIEEMDLPLNSTHNGKHPFINTLKRLKEDARKLAILNYSS